MFKAFFRRVFDTLGLSASFDPVIAQNVDKLRFDARTGETTFLR